MRIVRIPEPFWLDYGDLPAIPFFTMHGMRIVRIPEPFWLDYGDLPAIPFFTMVTVF